MGGEEKENKFSFSVHVQRFSYFSSAFSVSSVDTNSSRFVRPTPTQASANPVVLLVLFSCPIRFDTFGIRCRFGSSFDVAASGKSLPRL